MRHIITPVVIAVLFVSGCSTMTPARYNVSVDNNVALKQHEGSRVHVAAMDAPDEYDPNCRLMGPIEASDGMTIPEFVQDAFNDEFKFANVYSEDGVVLTGKLTEVAFSSSKGMTEGWWSLALTLTSSNGNSMSVANRYDFKSGWDAITACNATADALGAAVQDLINVTVTDPQFETLIQ